MPRREPNQAWRLAVIHAGCGPASACRHLADRLLAVVCEVSPAPVEVDVIGVWELLASVHAVLLKDAWDVPLLEASKTLTTADGVVVVTPIVHGSYSGPFKSFVDVMEAPAWEGKPMLIAACGGTQRHCLVLEHVVRPLFVCLRSMVLPTAVFATGNECDPTGASADLDARLERAARELVATVVLRQLSSADARSMTTLMAVHDA